LPHARATLEELSADYRLILITKGDLFDQERKLAQSGLGELFTAVEIVSDKTAATYERVFARHGDGPERAMMIGNSLRSDVLPVLGLGARAVHVPYPITWALEEADAGAVAGRYEVLDSLRSLPDALRRLDAG
jgi:putative hydrolase of the HAD superfamily